MAELVRHRQPKGSATDRLCLNHRATSRLYQKDRSEWLAQKAQTFADVMNNIRYYPYKIGRLPKADEKALTGGAITQKGLDYSKRMLFFWQKVVDEIPENIVKVALARAKKLPKWTRSPHLVKVERWNNKLLGIGKQGKAPITKMNYGLGIVNLILCLSTDAQQVATGEKGSVKRFEAGARLFVAMDEVFRAWMAMKGIEKIPISGVLEDELLYLVTGQPTFISEKGLALTPRAARIGASMTVLGIVANVWIVYTSFDTALTAWKNRDDSVMWGAGVSAAVAIVATAHLIAVGFSGFGVAWMVAFAAAGWIPVVAGLILFATMISMILSTDSAYETFTDSSYFADAADHRNVRNFGGKDHWAGPEPTDKDKWAAMTYFRNWPVAHQRIALVNLLSGFTVSSTAYVDQTTESPGPTCKLKALDLTIQYPSIPVGSRFQITFAVKWDPHLAFVKFYPDRDGRKEQRLVVVHQGRAGGDKWTVEAQSQPGDTRHTLKITNIPESFTKLDAAVELWRSDGPRVLLDHRILEVWTMSETTDGEVRSRVNVQQPRRPSGPASKIAGVNYPPHKPNSNGRKTTREARVGRRESEPEQVKR